MKVIRPFINVLEISPRLLGGADFVHRLQQTGLRRIEVSTKLNLDHYDHTATLSTRVKNSQNVKLLPRYIDEIIVSATPGINHEMTEVENILDVLRAQKTHQINIRGRIPQCWDLPTRHNEVIAAISKYVELGVSHIDLCDTLGETTPKSTHKLLNEVFRCNFPVEFGLETPRMECALIGICMGVKTLYGSLGGGKEHVDTLDLAVELQNRGVYTGVDLEELYELRKIIHVYYLFHYF